MGTDRLIEVNDLSKMFESLKGERTMALDKLTFQVFAKEFVSIVGVSGCGKSTTLRIISGLMPATKGDVSVHGRKLQGPLTNIGFVFQSPTLFPWLTVLGNILLPFSTKKIDKNEQVERAMKMIKSTGLQGFENKYPFELSGGMQQRVSISRALIQQPEILLMDEPFGALDAITREEMGVQLVEVWEKYKVTTVFVTHDISESVFLSDRVLVMSPRPGKIVKEIRIDIPRPREPIVKDSPVFSSYVHELRETLGLEKAPQELVSG